MPTFYRYERLEIALEDRAKAVSLFWGDPAPYLRKAKEAGAVVIQTVATPEEARRAGARCRGSVAGHGCPTTGKRPREGELIGAFPNGDPIRRYAVPAPTQGATGEIEAFALYAGQSVGLIRDLPAVASVMAQLAGAFA